MQIFEYVIEHPIMEFEIPGLVKMLNAKCQHEQIVVYALIDEEARDTMYSVKIELIDINHSISNNIVNQIYLGTVLQSNGNLVRHIFCCITPDITLIEMPKEKFNSYYKERTAQALANLDNLDELITLIKERRFVTIFHNTTIYERCINKAKECLEDCFKRQQ